MIKIYSKKSMVLIITVLFLLLIFSFSIQAAENEFNLDQLKNPTTITQLLENFSKIEFSMIETEAGKLTRKLKIEINHEGKKELQGIETNKVTIQGTGTDEIPFTQIWFDGEEVVKVVVDDQELPPVMAKDFAEGMLSSALAPFMYFEEYDLEDAEEFKIAKVRRRKRVLAGKEVQVTEYYMENLGEYGLKSGVISIAKFEDFLLLENYKVVTLDGIGINYILEEIEF